MSNKQMSEWCRKYLFGLFMLLGVFVYSQEKVISGIVTDLDNVPLAGVNVIVPSTEKGTMTDFDGNYSIVVATNAMIKFSYVGYESQEVVVNDQNQINIILKEAIGELDEIVVVGYGTQKKINVTGAISTIDAAQIESRPVTSVASAVQGLVPNLAVTSSDGGRPGSSMNWQIRGTGSIGNASSSPLIMVDGVPGNPDILNPEDIESISVLKDAAASAIYGSRAPYGVILITTKKGKSGIMRVSASSTLSIRTPTETLDKMGSLDFMNYMNEGLRNTGNTPFFDDNYIAAVEDHIADPTLPDVLPNNDNTRWDRYVAVDVNWFEEVYKKSALTKNNNLSFSGGTDKINYFVSLGYLNQGGQYRYGNDGYKRYTGLAKITAQATKWLEINYRMQAARSNTNRPNIEQQYEAFRRWPTDPVFDPNGNFTNKAYSLHIADQGGRRESEDDQFNNTLGAVINPFKDFKITTNFSFNTHTDIYKEYQKILYEYGPTGEVVGTQREANISYARKRFSVNKFYDINIYADYDKTIKEHYFGITSGFQQSNNHWYNLDGYRNDLINENIIALSAASGEDISISDGETEWITRGVFARLNYRFKDKFLLEINGRYDGSSRFAQDERWGLFPSVSAGYIISKENFLKNISSQINQLKLRVSYGTLGNSNVDNNYYTSTMNKVQSGYMVGNAGFLDYVSAPSLGNYNLTWEKPTTFNIGLDATVFNNSLQFTLDWYKRKTIDMVGPQEPLPSVLGTSVPDSNNTEMEGTGFEFSTTYKHQIGKDFNYDVTFNISTHKEKILKYYNPSGYIYSYYEGQRLGEIWGYETDGFINTEDDLSTMPDQSDIGSKWDLGDILYTDLNGDGKVNDGDLTLEDHGDLKRIGNSTPKFEYNISAGAAYKGFNFRMYWRGMGHTDWWPGGGQGAYAYYTDEIFFGVSDNKYNFTALNDHKDHWTPENQNAYYPRPLVQGGNSYKNIKTQTKYLQDRAFLRLKSLQVGYTIPTKVSQKFGIQKINILLSGENLVTFTKLRIYDPERPGLIYPLQKVYALGLRLNF
tara:strand:+ start:1387 stop:4515 length:3129 start_codon:yes stop_codon:yes gene_type:complete